MLVLNVLNKKLSDSSLKEMSKYDVYKYYLTITNISTGIFTNRQIDLLSFILSSGIDPGKRGSNSIISNELGMSSQHISNIKAELIKNDYMNINGELHSYFVSLRNMIDSVDEIEISLKMKL